MDLIKLFQTFARQQKKVFCLLIFFSLGLAGICIYIPWVLKNIADIAEQKIFFEHLGYSQILILFMSLTSIYFLYRLIVIYANQFIQLNIKNIRTKILNHAFKNTYSFAEKITPSHLAHHVIHDINGLEIQCIHLITFIFFDVFVTLGILIFMYKINVLLFIVELIFLIMSILYIHFLGHPLYEHNQSSQTNLQKLNTKFQDIIHGLSIIHIFNLRKKQLKIMNHVNQQYFNESMKLSRAEAVIMPFDYCLEILGIILIVLVAAYLIQINLISPSYLIAFIMYAEILAEPASHLSGYIVAVQKIKIFLHRLSKIIPNNNIHRPSLFSNQITINQIDNIDFEHLYFKYPLAAKNVIHDIHFSAKKGDIIRISGKNGAGKSTLMELLMGFLKPNSGQIKISSHDLFSLKEEHWRQMICMMPQKPYFFEESLEYNLTFFNPKITPEKLQEIIQTLELQTLIDSLPEGLKTILNHTKHNLSGGEYQKLSLARVLLLDPEIIILDEPFNHLDTKTSEILKSVLYKISPHKIIFIIEHHESIMSQLTTQTIQLL